MTRRRAATLSKTKEKIPMRRLTLISCVILGCASWSFAQKSEEYPKNEFFAGYSFHSADINTLTIDPHRTGQHGLNLEYTRNLSGRLALTGDVSAHFKRASQTITGGIFESKRDQYYLLGGLQFSARSQSRAKPFARVMVGASLFRGFTSSRTTAGNVFTFDDATSLALALGGGLDIRVSKRVSLRVIQADYIPTFFGSGHQNNFRLSFGVVF
jgi:opacity protein-like surface antigen